MKLTAEMSLYPLREDYVPAIQAFIDAAAQHHTITRVTNAMSTQVSGDWEAVMALVDQCLQESYQRFGKQILVCKFIPGELDIDG